GRARGVRTAVLLEDDAGTVGEMREPGRAPRRPIAPPLRTALQEASILVPRGFAAARVAAWRRGAAAARTAFRRHGYAILPPLLPSPFVAAMAAHIRGLITRRRVALGDGHSPL